MTLAELVRPPHTANGTLIGQSGGWSYTVRPWQSHSNHYDVIAVRAADGIRIDVWATGLHRAIRKIARAVHRFERSEHRLP